MARVLNVDCGDIRPWRCSCAAGLAINKGNACIVQKDNVLEYGQVISEIDDPADLDKGAPVVLRRATLQDRAAAGENVLLSKNAWRLCSEKISSNGLNMRLVRVHYSFDRSRLTVVFTAEERLDYRQLVHDLSAELHLRVEMKQIGARDAAALRGGMAPCGRIMCCKSWLQKFDNVNVRLAKNQGVPLRQSSINGMCGRLKCCLRFEYFSSYKGHDTHAALEAQEEREDPAGEADTLK